MAATAHTKTTRAHAAVAEQLTSAGQRYTGNRRRLVEILATQERPGTINEVLASAREMAQSSTYRNLALLEAVGVVHRIVTDGEFARFELAEGVTGNHHHHLVCHRCGLVTDVTLPEDLEATLDAAVDRAADRTGFSPDGHRLDVLGLCATCG